MFWVILLFKSCYSMFILLDLVFVSVYACFGSFVVGYVFVQARVEAFRVSMDGLNCELWVFRLTPKKLAGGRRTTNNLVGRILLSSLDCIDSTLLEVYVFLECVFIYLLCFSHLIKSFSYLNEGKLVPSFACLLSQCPRLFAFSKYSNLRFIWELRDLVILFKASSSSYLNKISMWNV